MAIWQFEIFMVPKEEVHSYFGGTDTISNEAFNEIKWWKYYQPDIEDFDTFQHIIPKGKSWSNDIMLFGDESSNCIEIVVDQSKIDEVSIRIDLRTDYKPLIKLLCDFAQRHKCLFISGSLEVISPDLNELSQYIKNYPKYKAFLDSLTE